MLTWYPSRLKLTRDLLIIRALIMTMNQKSLGNTLADLPEEEDSALTLQKKLSDEQLAVCESCNIWLSELKALWVETLVLNNPMFESFVFEKNGNNFMYSDNPKTKKVNEGIKSILEVIEIEADETWSSREEVMKKFTTYLNSIWPERWCKTIKAKPKAIQKRKEDVRECILVLRGEKEWSSTSDKLAWYESPTYEQMQEFARLIFNNTLWIEELDETIWYYASDNEISKQHAIAQMKETIDCYREWLPYVNFDYIDYVTLDQETWVDDDMMWAISSLYENQERLLELKRKFNTTDEYDEYLAEKKWWWPYESREVPSWKYARIIYSPVIRSQKTMNSVLEQNWVDKKSKKIKFQKYLHNELSWYARGKYKNLIRHPEPTFDGDIWKQTREMLEDLRLLQVIKHIEQYTDSFTSVKRRNFIRALEKSRIKGLDVPFQDILDQSKDLWFNWDADRDLRSSNWFTGYSDRKSSRGDIFGTTWATLCAITSQENLERHFWVASNKYVPPQARGLRDYKVVENDYSSYWPIADTYAGSIKKSNRTQISTDSKAALMYAAYNPEMFKLVPLGRIPEELVGNFWNYMEMQLYQVLLEDKSVAFIGLESATNSWHTFSWWLDMKGKWDTYMRPLVIDWFASESKTNWSKEKYGWYISVMTIPDHVASTRKKMQRMSRRKRNEQVYWIANFWFKKWQKGNID